MVCSFYREFHSDFYQRSTFLVDEFVVLTDGESYDPHLFSRTRTFHSQMFFSGSTTIGSSYVTRGSAVEFRLVLGFFVPDKGLLKHLKDLVVGDRCRHPQFRLEPEPVSVGSQNAELVSIPFAHLVSTAVLTDRVGDARVNQFHLVSLRCNGIPTLLRQGSLPIPERIFVCDFPWFKYT